MNAVNGGKTHSEAVVRRPAIYSLSGAIGNRAGGEEVRRAMNGARGESPCSEEALILPVG